MAKANNKPVCKLPFPLAGYNVNRAYAAQPPHTTSDCLNVRGYSVDKERARGGSRPGIVPAYAQVLGSPSPVQRLDWMDYGVGAFESFSDDFLYPLNEELVIPPALVPSLVNIPAADGLLNLASAYGSDGVLDWSGAGSAIRCYTGGVTGLQSRNSLAFIMLPSAAANTTGTTITGSAAYAPVTARTWNNFTLSAGVFWSFATAFNSSGGSVPYDPDPGDSSGTIVLSIGAYSLTITIATTAGSPANTQSVVVTDNAGLGNTYTGASSTYAAGITIPLQGGKMTVLWNGVAIFGGQFTYAMTFTTAGFTLSGQTTPFAIVNLGNEAMGITLWSFAPGIDPSTSTSRSLVAISHGTVYAESSSIGTLTSQGAAVSTSATQLSTAVCNGELFIADGTTIKTFGWLPTSFIRTFAPCRGQIEGDCTIVANWRNRVLLAGAKKDPQNIFMSRIDDAYDFDYGQDDASAAIALNSTVNGRIGNPITAICPCNQNMALVGTTRSVWVLRGDPGQGGMFYRLVDTVGILSQSAWCMDRDGILYFLGADGFYEFDVPNHVTTFTHLETPKNITGSLIPALGRVTPVLPGTTWASGQVAVSLIYDSLRHGVDIFLTPYGSTPGVHYFYDIRNHAFWPESYPLSAGPMAACWYNSASATYRKLLFGGIDGNVYTFSEATASDATAQATTQAISSYVTMGPYRFGDGRMASILGELVCDMSTGTSATTGSATGPTVSILTGPVAESLTVAMTRIVQPGRNVFRQRVRGMAHGVKIANSTISKLWALEAMTGRTLEGGEYHV